MFLIMCIMNILLCICILSQIFMPLWISEWKISLDNSYCISFEAFKNTIIDLEFKYKLAENMCKPHHDISSSVFDLAFRRKKYRNVFFSKQINTCLSRRPWGGQQWWHSHTRTSGGVYWPHVSGQPNPGLCLPQRCWRVPSGADTWGK